MALGLEFIQTAACMCVYFQSQLLGESRRDFIGIIIRRDVTFMSMFDRFNSMQEIKINFLLLVCSITAIQYTFIKNEISSS